MSNAQTRIRWFVGGIAIVSAIGGALLACSSEDDPKYAVPGGTQNDDGTFNSGTYSGPTVNGNIPYIPADAQIPEQLPVPDGSHEVDLSCCIVTLTLPDATGAETVHVLHGDVAPLNAAGGVPLTYSAGAWRANVCLSVNATYRYFFDFTERDDAGAPTGLEEDVRYNESVENENNGNGGRNNLFESIPACSIIDASVGMTDH